jgi:DNA-binding transcriptional ArsR family regulator
VFSISNSLASLRYFYYYGNMEVKTAVIALTALAQESRLRVFRLLVPAGPTGLPAGEIAEELDIPAATLTFHLKELSHAGLIDSEREGRSIRYSLRVEGIQELLNYLLHDCCKGRPELCGPGECSRKRKATASR